MVQWLPILGWFLFLILFQGNFMVIFSFNAAYEETSIIPLKQYLSSVNFFVAPCCLYVLIIVYAIILHCLYLFIFEQFQSTLSAKLLWATNQNLYVLSKAILVDLNFFTLQDFNFFPSCQDFNFFPSCHFGMYQVKNFLFFKNSTYLW